MRSFSGLLQTGKEHAYGWNIMNQWEENYYSHCSNNNVNNNKDSDNLLRSLILQPLGTAHSPQCDKWLETPESSFLPSP